ncbi:GNAT family N-acetyltransferase [Bradyrhizobium sp. 5.13L]
MNKLSNAFDIVIEQSFDFLSPEFAELFDRSAATAFQHPIWLHSLYTRLAPETGATPLVVVVRYRATDALAMVLPLLRIRRGPLRTVEFADLRVSDYLAPVCSPDVFSQLLDDAAACAQIRRLVRPFDLLRMVKLPDGRLAIENLLGASRRVSMDTNAYATVLIAPFEQWRASAIDRSYQKELAKKYRQLQKKGTLSFSCCGDGASVLEVLDVMRKFRGPRFHAQGDGDLLQRPAYYGFYSDVALRGMGSFVRLYAMKMDGEVIAAVLGLCHRDRFLVIMSAFDITGYKSQSIGALMFEQVARDCIGRGDQMLDFTIGDEPYKKLFGAQPSPVWAVTQVGSTTGAIAVFALKQAPWLKRAAKRLSDLRLQPARPPTPTR